MREHAGFTLLEAMLVMAIGALLLVMSLRQYQTYRLDANVQVVKANVDTIFQAMASFYRANCYGMIDPNYANQNPYGAVSPALLSPIGASPLSPQPASLSTLVQEGYLISKLSTIFPLNPLVNSDETNYGYTAQFNQYQTERKVCTTPASATVPVTDPYDTAQCTIATTIATIYFWKIQVAVELGDTRIAIDPTLAQTYLKLLGGDCLSSLDGSTVTPCSQSGGIGNYVVWERLPSFASPKTQSDYWLANPNAQLFNQMYQLYPTAHLLNTNGQVLVNNGSTMPQYVLCAS